jgi:hypothetical protein
MYSLVKGDEVAKQFSFARFTRNFNIRSHILMWITLPLVLAGCAVEYGRLKQSSAVTDAFDNGRRIPHYHYYCMSWGTLPFIIAGIGDNYTLDSELWEIKNLNERPLEFWVGHMDHRFGSDMRGFYILDVYGNQIGVWYSSIRWATVKINNTTMTITLIPELPGLGGRK